MQSAIPVIQSDFDASNVKQARKDVLKLKDDALVTYSYVPVREQKRSLEQQCRNETNEPMQRDLLSTHPGLFQCVPVHNYDVGEVTPVSTNIRGLRPNARGVGVHSGVGLSLRF